MSFPNRTSRASVERADRFHRGGGNRAALVTGSRARNPRIARFAPVFPTELRATHETIVEVLHSRTGIWLADAVYDPVVRLTTREATFKDALLRQASLQDGHRIL